MWRFSAFDLLNFLYDEDELSGAARVVWGIMLSHTEQYAVRDILLECEYIDDECCERCERCECECGQAWSDIMAPCMPISTLSEMLTALDLVGCENGLPLLHHDGTTHCSLAICHLFRA